MYVKFIGTGGATGTLSLPCHEGDFRRGNTARFRLDNVPDVGELT